MPFYDSHEMNEDETPLADRISMGAILVATCTRAMLSFASIGVFDMDPAIEPSSFVGAVPAESVLLDALALGGAAWLLVRRAVGVVGSDWGAALLAVLALPAIALLLVHGATDAEQLWRASTWIGGFALAIAIVSRANTESGPILQRAAVAAVGGCAVVMAVRGLSQMSVEHPAMVQFYEETRASFLTAHGWLADSPQALAYERRLMQNEATGWFGFSNVFATVAVASSLLMGNVALGRGSLAVRAGLLIAALLCAAIVVMSGSKGGVASLMIGIAASVLFRRGTLGAPLLMVVLPLGAIVGVIARGVVGSSWPEQSLLFRWHYLVGAVRTLLADPWTGVGPAGFQRAFLHFRPLESVEEVSSAHGSFADWMVCVGIAGSGLVALQLLLSWWGRPRLETPARSVRVSPGVLELALAPVVMSSVISIAFEASAIDSPAVLLWRLAGLALGGVTALGLVHLMNAHPRDSHRTISIGLAAASVVVLTHGQIDMLFWLPGSAMWGWLVISLAAAWNCAPARRACPRSARAIGVGFAAFFAVLATGLALVVRPALARQDSLALGAAVLVSSEAEAHSTERLAAARASAASTLAQAAQLWPPRGTFAVCAAEQWLSAASADPTPVEARAWLQEGQSTIVPFEQLDSVAFASRLVHSTLAIRAAEVAGGSWQDAETALEGVLAVNCRHTESWLRLAVVRERMGDRVGAADALQSALKSDETFSLDPLRQFSLQRRGLIEAHLRALVRGQ